MQLADDYTAFRSRALRRLDVYMAPYSGESEDVLHDVFLELIERYDTTRPCIHLASKLLKPRALNRLLRLRNVVGLPVHLRHEWNMEKWLENREMAGKARKALTQAEVSLLCQ